MSPSQEKELRMSAMNTHAPAEAEPKKRPGELLEDALPFIFAVPVAGPPAILLLGPLLILVLLLIPPAALLITLVLVVAVAGGLLAAVGALIASPYLLVRHLRERPAPRLPRLGLVRRAAARRHIPLTPRRYA
jgi:hypothetical protein